jgi:hypothetical protein
MAMIFQKIEPRCPAAGCFEMRPFPTKVSAEDVPPFAL